MERQVSQYPDVPAIKQFMEEYSKSKHGYKIMAEIAQEICERELEGQVRATYQNRAKEKGSLKEKLHKRHKDYVPLEISRMYKEKGEEVPNSLKGYREPKDIRDNIPDLAGVRIVMHYPHVQQWDAVDSMINKNFDVLERPSDRDMKPDYNELFPGYSGRHYRVRIRKEDARKYTSKGYEWHEQDRVEIQVRSVAVHAWAIVSHDVEYKPAFGVPVYKEEEDILRALNGLVHSEEVLIAQLWTYQQMRLLPFKSKYDLGTYLERAIGLARVTKDTEERVPIHEGKIESQSDFKTIEILRKVLERLQMNTVAKLGPVLRDLNFDDEENMIRKNIKEDFAGYKIRPSIYIMQHLLNLQPRPLPYDITMSSSYMDKCKVLVTVFIWIHKLFSEFTKIQSLFPEEGAGGTIPKSCMDFIYHSPMRWSIMEEADFAGEKEKAAIDGLWTWFEGQTAMPLVLVFDICRMNILTTLPQNLDKLLLLAHLDLRP